MFKWFRKTKVKDNKQNRDKLISFINELECKYSLINNFTDNYNFGKSWGSLHSKNGYLVCLYSLDRKYIKFEFGRVSYQIDNLADEFLNMIHNKINHELNKISKLNNLNLDYLYNRKMMYLMVRK